MNAEPCAWAAPAAAGEGVEGTAGVVEAADGAGAGGAAGVEVTALDGVEGACDEVPEEVALGYTREIRPSSRRDVSLASGLRTLETMHTMNPFSSMLYDSIVLSS